MRAPEARTQGHASTAARTVHGACVLVRSGLRYNVEVFELGPDHFAFFRLVKQLSFQNK